MKNAFLIMILLLGTLKVYPMGHHAPAEDPAPRFEQGALRVSNLTRIHDGNNNRGKAYQLFSQSTIAIAIPVNALGNSPEARERILRECFPQISDQGIEDALREFNHLGPVQAYGKESFVLTNEVENDMRIAPGDYWVNYRDLHGPGSIYHAAFNPNKEKLRDLGVSAYMAVHASTVEESILFPNRDQSRAGNQPDNRDESEVRNQLEIRQKSLEKNLTDPDSFGYFTYTIQADGTPHEMNFFSMQA